LFTSFSTIAAVVGDQDVIFGASLKLGWVGQGGISEIDANGLSANHINGEVEEKEENKDGEIGRCAVDLVMYDELLFGFYQLQGEMNLIRRMLDRFTVGLWMENAVAVLLQ
jgi:hypothetical protein